MGRDLQYFRWPLILAAALVSLAAAAQNPDPPTPPDPRPIPNLAELLTKVRKNQANIDNIRKDYICKVNTTIIGTDDKGNEKKREVEQSEMFYVAGKEVLRKIAKDGKPLTEDERKKEEEKVQKQIKKLEDSARKNSEEDGNSISAATFLKVSTLLNPRRVHYRDHEVLAVDFAPNLEVKPNTKAEQIAHKISGTIWVDEEAFQVVRLDAKLDESFKLAGGLLASVKPGSGMVFEQQRINDELWMPASAQIVYSARVLFSGKHGRIDSQFTDYRRFRATSEIKGFQELPPEAQKQ